MSTLSHPNIAAVHDWGEEQVGKRTTVYAVVEHLSGGSLRDLFDRGRYLDPSQALVVGLEACRGLDFAHRKGLVHTELTPAKLVFGDDRRLRIVDFGLARLLGAHDWAEPATVATHVARYSSPEQALGQPIDGKTDVYSLALILVEAVTGTVPFAARSTVATLSARIGRLMPVSADLGPLASVLEKAGRPEPADRSTAAELGRGARPRGREAAPPEADPDPRHRRCSTTIPTGCAGRTTRPAGITRPAPADEPVALVPPVPAPEQPAAEPAAGAATTPEEAAAVAAARGRCDRSHSGSRAGGRRSRRHRRCPPPVVDDESPRLYDGDADRTVDELAALATATAAADAAPLEAPAADPSPGDPGWSASLETRTTGGRAGGGRPGSPASSWSSPSPDSGYLAYRLFHVPTHEVPDLVGLDEAAAEAQTADFDWDLDVETARSDEQPEPGRSSARRRSAGERARRGRAVPRRRQRGPGVPRAARLRRPDRSTRPRRRSPSCASWPCRRRSSSTRPCRSGSVISWSVPAEPVTRRR